MRFREPLIHTLATQLLPSWCSNSGIPPWMDQLKCLVGVLVDGVLCIFIVVEWHVILYL